MDPTTRGNKKGGENRDPTAYIAGQVYSRFDEMQ